MRAHKHNSPARLRKRDRGETDDPRDGAASHCEKRRQGRYLGYKSDTYDQHGGLHLYMAFACYSGGHSLVSCAHHWPHMCDIGSAARVLVQITRAEFMTAIWHKSDDAQESEALNANASSEEGGEISALWKKYGYCTALVHFFFKIPVISGKKKNRSIMSEKWYNFGKLINKIIIFDDDGD